jgi:membrane-associated phospholipid phosphatase
MITLSKPFSLQVARALSTILSPFVIAVPFVFLVAYSTNEPNALLFAALTLFFLSIGPLIYILIGTRLGKFTDFDVSVRSQRTGPLLFSSISSLLGYLVLATIHGPKNLESVLLIAVISSTLLLLISFWWKMSMHATSLASAVTMLSMLYGYLMLSAFLLVILVSWSRVVLRRHNIAQVTIGSFMGIALTWLFLTLRGF